MTIIILQPRGVHNQEENCTKAVLHLEDPSKSTNKYSDLKLDAFKSIPTIQDLRTKDYSNSLFILAGLDYSDKRIPGNQVVWSRLLTRLNVMPGCSIYIFEHIIYDQIDGCESLLSRTIVRLSEKRVRCYNTGCVIWNLKLNRHFFMDYTVRK